MKNNYIIACCTPWFWKSWDKKKNKGNWFYVSNKTELENLDIATINPRYIFFPHWRDKVPASLTDKYECICFHMTPLPYGRGGSPLQNMIIRGHKNTKLTAIRMGKEIDTGPIYFQKNMSLLGRAEEIYLRAGKIMAKMVKRMIKEEPLPKPQKGKPVYFLRRKPQESKIPDNIYNLDALYDFIRMLDAEGYPKAFLCTKNLKLFFKRPVRKKQGIKADVLIELNKKDSEKKRNQ